MLQIVGFGEVVRFDKGLRSQKEMCVVDSTGVEHGIPVTEEVIQSLLNIIVGLNKKPAAPVSFVRSQVPAELPPATSEDEAPDVGEVGPDSRFEHEPPLTGNTTSAGPTSGDEHETPLRGRMPRPRFLEDDEDGKQI